MLEEKDSPQENEPFWMTICLIVLVLGTLYAVCKLPL